MSSAVSRPSAADFGRVLKHFQGLLEFETNCWDARHAMSNNRMDFVLLVVSAETLFKEGHIEGPISLPHTSIIEETLKAYPWDTLFVVYCAGPHCNGKEKAAVRIAKLGRPVKKMIGGVTAWIDEGFDRIQ